MKHRILVASVVALATASCSGSGFWNTTSGDYPEKGWAKPGSAPVMSGSSIPASGPSAGYANPPGAPGRTQPATQNDVLGHQTPSPGMDTKHGGSSTQSLGQPSPGTPATGGSE
jgi:hypothetical protein